MHFLKKTPKALTIKGEIDRLVDMKMRNFWSSKDINKEKRLAECGRYT